MIPPRTLVWDTTGPAYAQACGQMAWLIDAAGTHHRHLVPSAVVEELASLGITVDEETATHVEIVDCSQITDLHEIAELAAWMRVLGTDPAQGHNVGDSHVALIASRDRASVAVVDDGDARAVMRRNAEGRFEVHGVLWAIARGVVEERAVTPNAYSGLCDAMLRVEHPRLQPLRWPFQPGGFPAWFQQNRAHLEG